MSHSTGLSRSHHELTLARLRSSRARPAWHRPLHPAPAPLLPERQEVRPEEIRFRRLTTLEEIAGVLPLRREINLPQAGDPGFALLEKKETSAALSAPSSGVDKASAPSASFRSARASRPARPCWPAPACRLSCSPTAGK